MWLALWRLSPICCSLCMDWFGYFETLATVLLADLHWRTCFSCMNVFSNMNTGSGIQLWIFLVGCHPFWLSLSNSACGLCKWLVYVASLLAPMPNLLLFFVLIGLDNIVKTLPRCYLQTCWKTCFFPAKNKKHRQQQHPIPFDAVAMKATASIIREKITQDLRCLQLVFACSGPNQAHNLTNIFCMNVLANMNKGSGIQLCVFLVGCHPSDSDLAIQFLDWCKWLVYVASLLAPKPHLSMWCIWSRY